MRLGPDHWVLCETWTGAKLYLSLPPASTTASRIFRLRNFLPSGTHASPIDHDRQASWHEQQIPPSYKGLLHISLHSCRLSLYWHGMSPWPSSNSLHAECPQQQLRQQLCSCWNGRQFVEACEVCKAYTPAQTSLCCKHTVMETCVLYSGTYCQSVIIVCSVSVIS